MRKLPIEKIKQAVSKTLKVSVEDIMSRNRHKEELCQ